MLSTLIFALAASVPVWGAPVGGTLVARGTLNDAQQKYAYSLRDNLNTWKHEVDHLDAMGQKAVLKKIDEFAETLSKDEHIPFNIKLGKDIFLELDHLAEDDSLKQLSLGYFQRKWLEHQANEVSDAIKEENKKHHVTKRSNGDDEEADTEEEENQEVRKAFEAQIAVLKGKPEDLGLSPGDQQEFRDNVRSIWEAVNYKANPDWYDMSLRDMMIASLEDQETRFLSLKPAERREVMKTVRENMQLIGAAGGNGLAADDAFSSPIKAY